VYRLKAAQSEQALWDERLRDCTFQPKLYTRKPGKKKQSRQEEGSEAWGEASVA
jgi:hypothetical protein